MEENLKEAFLKAKLIPEDDLSEKVWQTLVERNKRLARLKLAVFLIIGSISFVSLIPTLKMLVADFSQSGFYEYLSLGFSSNGTITNYWKDFLWLLAESLPTTSILMTFTLIFIFFISLKYATRQIIKGQLALSF